MSLTSFDKTLRSETGVFLHLRSVAEPYFGPTYSPTRGGLAYPFFGSQTVNLDMMFR